MPNLTLSCAACGTEFTTHRPNARFCSELCRARAKNRRSRGEPEAEQVIACPVCDEQFTVMQGARTCSELCAQRRRWRLSHDLPVRDADQGPRRAPRRQYERTCEECGVTYFSARPTGRFCSRRCNMDSRWERPGWQRPLDDWLALVDRSGDGCHLWPEGAPLSSQGYPSSRDHEMKGDEYYVHRILMVRRFGGPIPAGWEPDHTCRNKRCVREEHHELVPHGENLRRAVPHRLPQKRRVGRCPHDDADVYWDKDGKRNCRICRRERFRMWREDEEARRGTPLGTPGSLPTKRGVRRG